MLRALDLFRAKTGKTEHFEVSHSGHLFLCLCVDIICDCLHQLVPVFSLSISSVTAFINLSHGYK